MPLVVILVVIVAFVIAGLGEGTDDEFEDDWPCC